MAEIEVGQEVEHATSWAYDVTVFADGRTFPHAVTLSFQDYDLWCRGRVSPSRVVEAVFKFLLDHGSAQDIPPKFDCSVVRRKFDEADAELPKLI
ncbi:hypothetical protein [Algisphaera agarilytica]|uniref:Uncharacterized protein n=1 Tax=Algisphaera agarilytica TaxID=1385975 RepID=A0A7X0H719_9BACT|nr:hypothetical protein [Algisphaera agarilytica]MBB6430252.1 hypothetical protein [Algisphaera agarilytica]